MARRIAVIQGHPDPAGGHFGHALADAYMQAAEEAGHEVRLISVAALEFPFLRSQSQWRDEEPPEAIRAAQETIRWAEHLVLFYPLWLGTMPSVLKAFLEQTLRPGFALGEGGESRTGGRLLKGRTARVVVTMGMPAWLYRWYFRAHSLKSLERNVLAFCGIGPVRETLMGMVESGDDASRRKRLDLLRELGRAGR